MNDLESFLDLKRMTWKKFEAISDGTWRAAILRNCIWDGPTDIPMEPVPVVTFYMRVGLLFGGIQQAIIARGKFVKLRLYPDQDIVGGLKKLDPHNPHNGLYFGGVWRPRILSFGGYAPFRKSQVLGDKCSS